MRLLRWWLRPPHRRDLILQPDLHPITDRLEGVALRLGGGTIRLEREEDRQDRAAGQVELLLQGKALEGVEDVAATVLEVLGEGAAQSASAWHTSTGGSITLPGAAAVDGSPWALVLPLRPHADPILARLRLSAALILDTERCTARPGRPPRSPWRP